MLVLAHLSNVLILARSSNMLELAHLSNVLVLAHLSNVLVLAHLSNVLMLAHLSNVLVLARLSNVLVLLVAINHIPIWYFCNVCTGPTHPISCIPTTTPPHNLNFPQPFVIFIISYIFTSLNQSYPCYCSETCTEPTNSIFFVFHVAPGLCHLDYSFSVCKISHKLNFCFIYMFFCE